jgi:hypothetical protein
VRERAERERQRQFASAAALTRSRSAAIASRHSSEASTSGTSGIAITPSSADSGISIASMPARQPASAPNQRRAMRTTSHGSASQQQEGQRSASACSPPSARPACASQALSPGRSE